VAHQIFGQRFLGNRQPAWHGLGRVFTDPMTATDAVRQAGADFQVIKLPLTVNAPDGYTIELPEKVALMREPVADDNQYRLLGTAGPDYAVIQNTEIARVLDGLTEEWPVETVGVLGKGETLFISLKAGRSEIAGDEVEDYFLVTDTKDGGTTLRILYTPVRVVCQNTLVAGIRAASTSAQLGHRQGLEAEYNFRVNLMAQLRRSQDEVKAKLTHLAAMRLAEQQVNDILATVYPEPTVPQKAALLSEMEDAGQTHRFSADVLAKLQTVRERHEYASERVQAFRNAAEELYIRFNDEHPRNANTGWALYNAVVESADYRNGSSGDNISKSAVFGNRAAEKSRAYAALTALI